MVCKNSGLDGQVLCILSYEGSALDVKINYTVLAANLFIAAIPFFQWHRSDDTPSSRARSERRGLGAICSLLFVILFQISLCLIVHCAGISIVWCAVGGWILMDWKSGETDIALARQQAAVLTIDLLAMTYYLIVADAITTLAHM